MQSKKLLTMGIIFVIGFVVLLSTNSLKGTSVIITSTTTGNYATPNSSIWGTAIDEVANVTYCTINGDSEQLNVWIPAAAQNGTYSYPAMVMVHGGAWETGNDAIIGPGLSIALEGVVVVSINYFMSLKTVPFPTNVEDVACAVRYLRANAFLYHIDPSRISLFGGSAGGHLVYLEALASLNGTFDNVGQWLGYSSTPQAVVGFDGPANLTDSSFVNSSFLDNYYLFTCKCYVNLPLTVFGNMSGLFKGSPVNYVHPGQKIPPFFMVEGLNDTTVYPVQAYMLYNVLNANGDNVTLVTPNNWQHGGPIPGLVASPTQGQVYGMWTTFLLDQLVGSRVLSVPVTTTLYSTTITNTVVSTQVSTLLITSTKVVQSNTTITVTNTTVR